MPAPLHLRIHVLKTTLMQKWVTPEQRVRFTAELNALKAEAAALAAAFKEVRS